MRPGDPFETEAFDVLRSAQRLALRLVPDWELSRFGPSAQSSHAWAPDGLLEQELRRAAEDCLRELADLLPQLETHTRAVTLSEFINQAGAEVTVSFGTAVVPQRVFSGMQATLLQRISRDDWDLESNRQLAASLTRCLHLLAWADEVAADDYRDPRLRPDPREGEPPA
jgi:hypothetical protein